VIVLDLKAPDGKWLGQVRVEAYDLERIAGLLELMGRPVAAAIVRAALTPP